MALLEVNIQQAGYQINKKTISDIHFSIRQGELMGMIGANGAGKSTTIKAILDELPFVEGEISKAEGGKLSYIPERPLYYQELTLWEHFEFVAAVEELGEDALHYAKEILRQFRLSAHLHKFPGNFSKGMQQKGMLALALFTKPDLLIIDEPFMGLDPGSTKLLLDLLEEERSKGKGILMCTHILDTAQRMCDTFIIIEKGRMKAKGQLDEVLKQCGATDGSLYSCLEVEVEEDEE
ncbi:ABC transporter ATP-binding protein [Lederbergia galactosidilytica]|uniref:ABC transporter ATP-binding protein n=1 Tax=Lederbergia galactosidilytica TaxID=217031 RepID=A0A177ZJJ8_9BACI|nr:ABC transporter ATP-binding protein [Lederbergia galactosidilytica]MBP1915283.1 ABC-2 type transport system ATP-binding protein [Lederbergia galactosidilytica]OAK68112.1 ABC transporter ATP-binding protein [Lederbergia galactosidilytica]